MMYEVLTNFFILNSSSSFILLRLSQVLTPKRMTNIYLIYSLCVYMYALYVYYINTLQPILSIQYTFIYFIQVFCSSFYTRIIAWFFPHMPLGFKNVCFYCRHVHTMKAHTWNPSQLKHITCKR